MSKSEFDHFAETYRDVHKQNIAITGEGPEYFATYKMRDFAAEVTRSKTSSTGIFLDFGSGIGGSVDPFFESLPNANLVCADVSADSLKESKIIHGEKVRYVLIHNNKLSLQDSSVDGAFACCVFHHISSDEHAATLSELRRVLKPGAPLMIYEHNPYNPLTVQAVNTCPLDVNAVLIKAGEMKRRCAKAGYSMAKIHYRVFFPAGLKALRPLENHLRWVPLGAQYYIVAYP
jgi:ubiquinone/menaquinone biosynthesis C-methylase UbiE